MRPSPARFLFTHKIVLTIVLLLALLFVAPYIAWSLLPHRGLSVVLVDKTTGGDFREHKTFFWLLEHWKYVNPETGDYYDPRRDFYGFFPQDSSYSTPSQMKLDDVDLLYIADTYGVYTYPMDYRQYERLIPETSIPITLKYGGLTSTELDAIERYAASGRRIIAEFNTMEDPQQENAEVQHRLEALFGLRFTGALGRYYDDVNAAPKWVKDVYKKQYHEPWNFSGRGIIITVKRAMGDNRPSVVVLTSSDLSHTPVYIRTTEHPLLSGTTDNVPYYYFFEFMEAAPTSKVIAQYEVQCNARGKEKMANAGLPLAFPAVVLADERGHRMYCAGDFADNEVDVLLTKYWGAEYMLSRLFSFYFVSDQTRFFWKFYLPMMKNVFQDAAVERRHG